MVVQECEIQRNTSNAQRGAISVFNPALRDRAIGSIHHNEINPHGQIAEVLRPFIGWPLAEQAALSVKQAHGHTRMRAREPEQACGRIGRKRGQASEGGMCACEGRRIVFIGTEVDDAIVHARGQQEVERGQVDIVARVAAQRKGLQGVAVVARHPQTVGAAGRRRVEEKRIDIQIAGSRTAEHMGAALAAGVDVGVGRLAGRGAEDKKLRAVAAAGGIGPDDAVAEVGRGIAGVACTGIEVVADDTAAIDRRIAGQHTIEERGAGLAIVAAPAIDAARTQVGGVLDEQGVDDRGAGDAGEPEVVDGAASCVGVVLKDDAGLYARAGLAEVAAVEDARTKCGLVGGDEAMADAGIAMPAVGAVVEDAAAEAFVGSGGALVICVAHNKAVEDSRAVEAADVGDDVVAVVGGTGRADLAAEDAGGAARECALAQQRLRAGKTAIQPHAGAHVEGDAAVAAAGGVKAGGDPDFVARDGGIECGLQAGGGEGVGPGTAVLQACACGRDIPSGGKERKLERQQGGKEGDGNGFHAGRKGFLAEVWAMSSTTAVAKIQIPVWLGQVLAAIHTFQ